MLVHSAEVDAWSTALELMRLWSTVHTTTAGCCSFLLCNRLRLAAGPESNRSLLPVNPTHPDCGPLKVAQESPDTPIVPFEMLRSKLDWIGQRAGLQLAAVNRHLHEVALQPAELRLWSDSGTRS